MADFSSTEAECKDPVLREVEKGAGFHTPNDYPGSLCRRGEAPPSLRWGEKAQEPLPIKGGVRMGKTCPPVSISRK